MNDPKRRIQQSNSLNKNLIALVDVEELRTKGIFRSHDALLDWKFILIGLHQAGTSHDALTWHAALPAETGGTAHAPPGFVATLAVDMTFAGNGDVSFSIRINERMVIVTVVAFPPGQNLGKV